jgi:non-canonical purine NTP pyrophosphatase (RdgB/HAM1 family)
MIKFPIFITGNKHKAAYLGKLLGIPLQHKNIALEEIQSTDTKQITEDKARRAYEIVQQPVLVEDVGLYFEAWGDLPGPFIKFFVEQENGLENLCRMLDGFSSRRAKTVVTTTYYDGSDFVHFEGGASGEIADAPRGEGGFGYDAIWCVDGYGGRTRAELSEAEDNESYIAARPIEKIREFFGNE